MIEYRSLQDMLGGEEDSRKALSVARIKKAFNAEYGAVPRFHKGKYGKKYDSYTCGHCGSGIGIEANYCSKCGTQANWSNPRCLTGTGA